MTQPILPALRNGAAITVQTPGRSPTLAWSPLRGCESLSLVRGPAPHSLSPHQGTIMADEWPLHDSIEFGALPTAVGCARIRTKQLLWEWGAAELSERVEIIVSELTTNAFKASQAIDGKPPFRLSLMSDQRSVLVLVWDANPQPPMRLNGSPEDEGGRGLRLVESISDKWDWHSHPETGGKVVWALCQSQAI